MAEKAQNYKSTGRRVKGIPQRENFGAGTGMYTAYSVKIRR
jgi:hypothetical protein